MNTQINTQGLLTQREENVFELIGQGKTIKDAARCLRIARGTAYEHIERGKDKLNAETTPHAISLLWQQGHLRKVAMIFLALAIWAPARQAWQDSTGLTGNDDLIRTTRRTGRSRRNRRNTGKRNNDNHIIWDPDTNQLVWPELPSKQQIETTA